MERRRWLDDATFADVVALCQSLPGPTSSEVGMCVGVLRAGPIGAFAAWLGFTLPSALLMAGFASLTALPFELGWLFPLLQLLAFVVVSLAVWRMARALAWDLPRGTLALAAALLAILVPGAATQVAIIASAGLLGWLFLSAPAVPSGALVAVRIGRRAAGLSFALFLALLVLLPLGRALIPSLDLAVFDSFYRASALVFGGGHVLLPLLQAEVVDRGWASLSQFVAGYGATQLVPGPINTFAVYLGALVDGLRGAVLATVAVFLPAFLLVFAALPTWGALRERVWARRALRGVNAAVVGLLLAALVSIARAIASTLI